MIRPAFEKIAQDVLGLDTLETRNADSLDFHDLAVWQIREALERAYQAGKNEKAREAAQPW